MGMPRRGLMYAVLRVEMVRMLTSVRAGDSESNGLQQRVIIDDTVAALPDTPHPHRHLNSRNRAGSAGGCTLLGMTTLDEGAIGD